MKLLFALGVMLVTTCVQAEVTSYVQRQAVEQEAIRRVRAHDIAALDADATSLGKSRTRMPDGLWKLAVLYSGIATGLEELVEDDESWPALEAQLASYARQHPSSTNAWLIYGVALQSKAWHIRGNGSVNTVTAEGRTGFRNYMEKARKVLDVNKATLSSNPVWYAQRISVATYLGERRAKIDAIFREGISKEPLFHELYFSRLFQLMPHWGGSIDEMAAFMNETVRRPQPPEGISMYARLAWFAEGSGFHEVIDHPNIDWKLMKQSFTDILRLYPTDWNAQQFFFMACERPDKAEAVRLLAYLKEPPSPALLKRNIDGFRMCRDWASGKAPDFLMRDPQTGQEKLIK